MMVSIQDWVSTIQIVKHLFSEMEIYYAEHFQVTPSDFLDSERFAYSMQINKLLLPNSQILDVRFECSIKRSFL